MEQSQFDIRKIKAIIGLGNPGAKYYKNRHSIGFQVVNQLAEKFDTPWHSSSDMEYSRVFTPQAEGDQIHEIFLVKPMTFMNNSGRVIPWLLKKGIKGEHILVVHDDLERKFGKISLSLGGSHRGHNGLKSIIGVIGADFWRLRFGIGRPEDKDLVSSYVLSNFTQEEEYQLPELMNQAIELIFGI